MGAGLPIVGSSGLRAGTLLGVSMIPRAEIALLVARTGNRLGTWAVPDEVYGAVVCAAGLASIVSPLVLHSLLDRWSQVFAGEKLRGRSRASGGPRGDDDHGPV